MSATDWDVCPQCIREHRKDVATAEAELQSLYGKVEAKEYLKSLAEFEKFKATELEPTLREDYYQGIDEQGEYEVSYKASCDRCDYSFQYKHSVMTKLE